MKKILLSSMLLLGSFVFGQKFELGVKMGYLNSNLKITDFGNSYSFQSKHSAYMGIPVEYHLNDYFSLHGELAMAGLGAEKMPINGQNSRLHLTTILLPLGIKVYPIKQKLSVLGGFNLAFVTQALGKEDGKVVEYDNLNSSNHSFFVGAEYKITPSIFVETRYNMGVSNLVKEQGQIMKNKFFQIGVGYIFQNKKTETPPVIEKNELGEPVPIQTNEEIKTS